MKALILAAGEGRRLRPLTDSRPKCMVPFRGKPVLEWIVDTMTGCGINDTVVVAGYHEECITLPGVRKLLNPRYGSTNMLYTLFCAESELQGDVVFSYSDIIYTPLVLQTLLAAQGDFCVVIDRQWEKLWRLRMENPLDDAESLVLDSTGNIVEIGKKTNDFRRIQGQYIGLFKISAAALLKVRAFYHSLDTTLHYDGKDFENMYMTSFIQEIANRLMQVKAVPVDGGWLEIDSIEDLENYNKIGFYPALFHEPA